jgi:predicted metallopeptidase
MNRFVCVRGVLHKPLYTNQYSQGFAVGRIRAYPRIWLAVSILAPILVVGIVQSSYLNQSIQFQVTHLLDAKLIANGQ